MYSDTPGEKLVVKIDVDGVITDIEKTFKNCIDGDIGDYIIEKGYDLDGDPESGYRFAGDVCETTGKAYRDDRDLLVPREDDISYSLKSIKNALKTKTGKEVRVVISTSREGIDEDDLKKSLESMGIDDGDYDEVRIEDEKWEDCDILIEDNPHQIEAFLVAGDGQIAYHIKNESSRMVYGDRKEIYETGMCEKVDDFSDVIDSIAGSEVKEYLAEDISATA